MKKLLTVVLIVVMVISNVFAAVESVDSNKLTDTDYNNVLIIVNNDSENNSEVFINCKPEVKSGKVKLLLGRLISSLDYTAIDRNETEITISNGTRRIQLFYGKNEAKVDGKAVTLKNAFVIEEESANIYYNYIGIEDIETLFSYKVAYDKAANNVVLFATENTPEKVAIPEVPEASKPEATLEQKLADLKAYKIFQGDENGNLNLDKEITRAEFCKVICTALGYAKIEVNTADGSDMVYDQDKNVYVVSSESIFDDVAITHWAYGYIKAIYDLGYINGVGGNRFCPSDSITEIDAIKIIVSALGYTPQAEQTGGYPDGFRRSAERFGIVTTTPDKAILREKVVEYIYTALDIPLMAASGFDFATQSASYVILDGNNGVDKSTLRINLEKLKANEL